MSDRIAGIVEVPLADLTRPRDGDVLVDRWWAVKDGNALLYRHPGSKAYSPQCNGDQRAAELLTKRLYPDASVEFVPVAYVGPWDDEWGHQMRWLAAPVTDGNGGSARAEWVAGGDALLADYVAKRDARNAGSVAWFELNAVCLLRLWLWRGESVSRPIAHRGTSTTSRTPTLLRVVVGCVELASACISGPIKNERLLDDSSSFPVPSTASSPDSGCS